ncbi:MAG TPA: hypothetical protein VGR38_02910 [Candidatus Polarisedimenticolia bacterium]|nr:hypothetical protein [Candidatus Polarisedimenticolia bacterium]
MKIYRRSFGMRALSLGSLLLFALLEYAHLASGGKLLTFGGLLLATLVSLSCIATILNLGDRYGVDDQGIQYANVLLSRLGLSLERRVAWEEVVSVRAYHSLRFGVREDHPSALFLSLTSGKRFVVDSVERFDEIHRDVVSRATRAASGRAPVGPAA